ncbi:hypothetical protein CV093_11790 [Oceanobacillus sp. 143]|nr:hypothetical protein CV093_11790 [Oceanobacillus sp. 143]
MPYVLFIIAIVYIIVTTNIAMYRNDLQLTENQIEQVKIETLFQMQREQFKQEFRNMDYLAQKQPTIFLMGRRKLQLLEAKIKHMS